MDQREKLSDLMYWAFLEIRNLGSIGKAQQASDLADAFHNLPKGMMRDDFSLEIFRDEYLAPYQKKISGISTEGLCGYGDSNHQR